MGQVKQDAENGKRDQQAVPDKVRGNVRSRSQNAKGQNRKKTEKKEHIIRLRAEVFKDSIPSLEPSEKDPGILRREQKLIKKILKHALSYLFICGFLYIS